MVEGQLKKIKKNFILMAKSKGSNDNRKTTFGKRKGGLAKKSYNKHNPKPKPYRGQGR